MQSQYTKKKYIISEQQTFGKEKNLILPYILYNIILLSRKYLWGKLKFICMIKYTIFVKWKTQYYKV